MRKKYYWDTVSAKIGAILKKNISPDMSVLEVGFAGGHFLEWLNDNNYDNLHGIEIRKNQYMETQRAFSKKGLDRVDLLCGDVLEHDKKYDALYSTGLIQCLDNAKREAFLEHVSKLANIAIFTVPEILSDRNIGANVEVAVSGCEEYKTGNIPYELSNYYDNVRVGKINKSLTHLDDAFVYYICKNE